MVKPKRMSEADWEAAWGEWYAARVPRTPEPRRWSDDWEEAKREVEEDLMSDDYGRPWWADPGQRCGDPECPCYDGTVSAYDAAQSDTYKAVAAQPVYEFLESLGPKGDPRFHELLAQIGDLHDRKQADYGRKTDPFANVRASEDFGVEPWVGALIRANDKMRRLQAAARGSTLKNEGIEDSLMDLAVYALIGLILYREERGL